jgi:hypothetical protein
MRLWVRGLLKLAQRVLLRLEPLRGQEQRER